MSLRDLQAKYSLLLREYLKLKTPVPLIDISGDDAMDDSQGENENAQAPSSSGSSVIVPAPLDLKVLAKTD